MVGDEGRVVGKGQFGNRAGAVAGVKPALDGGPIKGVTRREYNRVGHYFERNRALEIVRELSRHSSTRSRHS